MLNFVEKLSQRDERVVLWALRHTGLDVGVNRVTGEMEMRSHACKESSRIFTPELFLDTLGSLSIACIQDETYELNSYHWLLLYEALQQYLSVINIEIRECSGHLVEVFNLKPLNFNRFIGTYFHDVNFLANRHEVGGKLIQPNEEQLQLRVMP